MEDEKSISLKCEMEKDGTVRCNITKEKFDEMQEDNIKVKQVIFDIQEELD